ncbi:MAG TPA: OB-fold nucleic acid binding domain-containing protein, partial [Acidocella sp.]|nr:OB-fold nucleic acid binding domain-containing protein [Acidocella sp.]
AACMSLSIANTDKLAILRGDAIRMGIQVLPPDVNKSGADFQPERQEDGTLAIRYALGAIKRVGIAAMADLAKSRGEKPFEDLSDFAARIDAKTITRGQIEILAKAGAFDSLEPNRAKIFTAAETIIRTAQSLAEEKESGQIGLFGGGAEPEKIRLPNVQDWPETDRLANEAEAIGFHVSAHPLDMYAIALKRLGVVPSANIERRAQAGASRVKLAGTVAAKKERITRTGSRMVWVTLSDTQGSFEVTLFSEVLSRVREYLSEGTALLVTADIKMEGESLRITASDVALLDDAAAKAGASLRIWLDRTEALAPIRALLDREGKGRGRVTLVPNTGLERNLDVVLPGGFNVTARLAQAMKLIPGVELVEDV